MNTNFLPLQWGVTWITGRVLGSRSNTNDDTYTRNHYIWRHWTHLMNDTMTNVMISKHHVNYQELQENT